MRGVPDVFSFVDACCGFLQALTPLQPRYAKKIVDADSLMAVLVAQAMNHGMLSMAETSDIPYDVYAPRPMLGTLIAALVR